MTEYNWLQKLNLEKIFKTESMWKLNFKGHKNKKKLYKIFKDFCVKFLNKSVILKIITDLYWKKSRIFTYAELCRFSEKSNKKMQWSDEFTDCRRFSLKSFPDASGNLL